MNTRSSKNSELELEELRTTTSILEVERMISKYTWNLPINSRPSASCSSKDYKYVVFTGSTGSIGSHVLNTLIRDSRVAHVYCLNRAANGEERQRISNESHGLEFDLSSDRVTFYQSDLSQEYLGLDISVYKSLLSEITHVIHNAWEVNFNLRLESFEPHILGVRQYVDFSARSAKGSSIFFVSSVSSCMNWSLNHDGPVPESAIDDPGIPPLTGYAQSKYVSEQILNRAAGRAGIPVTICRVGQVAGPLTTTSQKGCWNKQEWLPSLIASSKYLGKIPNSLGPNDRIDWIPVDVLNTVLAELMDDYTNDTNGRVSLHSRPNMTNGPHTLVNGDTCHTLETPQNASGSSGIEDRNIKMHRNVLRNGNPRMARNSSAEIYTHDCMTNSVRVYHAANPQHTGWSSLLPVIEKYFSNITMKTVPLQEWVDALSVSVEHTEDINTNPAIKLLEFFRNLLDGPINLSPMFETVETVRNSKELANLEAVKPEWMNLWLDQWDF